MKNDQKLRTTILSKKKLRKEIQGKRDSISSEDRKKISKIIAEKFYRTPYYKTSKNILAYYPISSEIDTTIVIKQALKNNKIIILPKVHNQKLKLFYVNKLSKQLKKGAYGIMEPDPRLCRPAEIKDIDLILVPGVGFDKNLYRLGYGRGYYDRFIPIIPKEVKKVAFCFDAQVVDEVPVSKHDTKMDLLITESKTYHS